MIETGLIEKLISFGGIGILAVILIWLLKQATTERQNVTDKFLATLETTIKSNAEGQVLMAGRLAELAAAEAEVDRLRSELVVQQARVRRWRLVVEAITPFLNDQARTAVDFQCMSDDLADIDEYHRPETENR